VRRGHRKCKSCRREWSHGRFPVAGFRLSEERWSSVVAAFLDHGTEAEVGARCALSHGTAHAAVRAVREAMSLDQPGPFAGTCEPDETYVGGAWRNKAIHIRRLGTKRGRGTSKRCVFGVACREAGEVRVWLVPDAKAATLWPLIRSQVVRGSALYSDGLKAYRRAWRNGYLHAWVDHDAGEYVRGRVHTQTIDGFWGYLKTAMDGIGGIKRENLGLFVHEQQWRYNHRKLTKKERAHRLLLVLKIGGRF